MEAEKRASSLAGNRSVNFRSSAAIVSPKLFAAAA
jgi:hypothetical protein